MADGFGRDVDVLATDIGVSVPGPAIAEVDDGSAVDDDNDGNDGDEVFSGVGLARAGVELLEKLWKESESTIVEHRLHDHA